MAKAWDIEPSIFAGMIEEDVGLKIRYIAIQILTAIDIAAFFISSSPRLFPTVNRIRIRLLSPSVFFRHQRISILFFI